MDHLFQAAIRSVLLAAVAGLFNVLGLWRVKSASVRHAVWTLVTASMLLQIALSPLLPEIPVRVLRSAEPVAIAVSSQSIPIADPGAVLDSRSALSWEQIAAAVYFCGLIFFAARLVFALIFALRLVRASEPAVEGANQSHRISAPLTIGNRILLPLSWSDWDSAKLQSVLAHEEAHVRRLDWAIAAMARLNRCVFWFHPLAWWLERQLARLAEQACDDAALAVVRDREQYARTLLEVARAIQYSRGRVLSAPMAKEANVETRINRILDETRRIPKALGRRGWTALAVFAVPLIYLAAAIQLAPAQTVTAPAPPAPPAPASPPPRATTQAPVPPAPPVPPGPPADAPPPVQPPQVPRADSPVLIPKVYNGQSKTFFFFNYEEYQNQKKKLQDDSNSATLPVPTRPGSLVYLTPAPSQATSAADESPLHVDVISVRMTRISIPFDPSGQYEVFGRITTTAGTFVTSVYERVDHRQAMEKQIPLEAGTYRLDVSVRNVDDRKITSQVISFEVK